MNQHVHQPMSDPTGTLPLQKKFRRAFDARWNSLKKMIPDAIAARTDAINMVTHSMLTGDDSIKAFQNWFDEALRIVVLGGNGTWSMSYVRAAGDHGIYRTKSMLPAYAMPEVDRVPLLQSMCIAEMQGIMEAVSQQAVRTFANGLLLKQPVSKIANDIKQIIDKTGKRRTAMLSSFMCVRTFSATTLDTFRAANVLLVGTVPERIALPSPIRDAKIKPPFNHGGLVADAKKKTKPKNLVEVLTAGDNKVCPICEDISEEGPYTLAEAEGLVPAHINCRCAFIPWVPRVTPFDALLLDKKDKLGHGSYKKGETPFIKPEDAKKKRGGIPENNDPRWTDGTFGSTMRKEGKNNGLYKSFVKQHKESGLTPPTPEKFTELVEKHGFRPLFHEGKLVGWSEDSRQKKPEQGSIPDPISDKSLQSKASHKQLFDQSLKTKMTPTQKKAVKHYTDDMYQNINGPLRKGKEPKDMGSSDHWDDTPSAKHVQLELDDMFKKTALAREIKTIRLVSTSTYKKMVAGDTFVDKGFVSTTTNLEKLDDTFDYDYGEYKTVHIVIPKGAKALPIAHISNLPDENEVLINRGSKFKVIKTKDSITLKMVIK